MEKPCDVSPLFIGGLGNRLYQLANAIYVAGALGGKVVYRELDDSTKADKFKDFGCFKIDDLHENGGHPTKYKLTDVFDIEQGDHHVCQPIIIPEILSPVPPCPLDPPVLSSELLQTLNSVGNQLVYLKGYYFNAEVVEWVLKNQKFPRFKISVALPVTGHIAHIRLGYEYDNFDLNTSYVERILNIIERIGGEWTIFTNRPVDFPLQQIKYVYGPDVDVYEALHMCVGAKIVVMSSSTLSAWMAFLSGAEVWCPEEYTRIHGPRAASSMWKIY